jgi:hypothetical protein
LRTATRAVAGERTPARRRSNGMASSTRGSSRPFAIAAATALGAIVLLALQRSQDLAAPAALGAPATRAIAADAAATPAADASAQRAAVARQRGCWTAPIGSTFRFRVTDRVDATLHSAEGGTQSAGVLHARCEVTTLVLDRRDGEVLTAQRIGSLQFVDAAGAPLPADPIAERLCAATLEPVLVRSDERGRLLGFGFPDGVDGDQRNFLRGTIALLFAEAPAGDATVWTADGEDTTGAFTARHELVDAGGADVLAVRRTRERYLHVVGQAELPRHELRGASTATFALDRGWLTGVELDEGMTLQLPLLDLRAISQRRASVVLVAASSEPVALDLGAAWRRAVAGVSSAGEQLGAHAAEAERRLWQQRLQGTSLAQLLADVRHLLATEPVDGEALDALFQQLQWLLRLDDAGVAAIAEQLTTVQLADGVARVAVGALGAAGTPAAQQALAAVRADASLDLGLRETATVSCLQLARPERALLAGLAADASGESPLRGQSLLTLGALAPRADGTLPDGRTVLDALLAMEGDAATRGELDTWVLAVGNTRSPQALAVATRLLGHELPAVRGACCCALRSLPQREALDALVERGLTDRDPSVRHEAVLALGRRGERAAREAVERTASGDLDLAVRERARRLLQQNG